MTRLKALLLARRGEMDQDYAILPRNAVGSGTKLDMLPMVFRSYPIQRKLYTRVPNGATADARGTKK